VGDSLVGKLFDCQLGLLADGSISDLIISEGLPLKSRRSKCSGNRVSAKGKLTLQPSPGGRLVQDIYLNIRANGFFEQDTSEQTYCIDDER
jgi:hypothetical protein